MLTIYWRQCCGGGYFFISLILWAFAGYAYLVNARRLADDPEKKSFHPAAVYLAPITWFPLLIASIVVFIIRALLYGVFLVLFTIALVAIRKPFLLVWLDKVARKIGNKLLEVNTFLARQLFPQWNPQNA
jgi:hypothetical protein